MLFGEKNKNKVNNDEKVLKAQVDSAFKAQEEEKERERLENIKNELEKERKKLEYERWFCSLSIEDQKKEEERVREEKRLEAERRQAYEEEKLKEEERRRLELIRKSEERKQREEEQRKLDRIKQDAEEKRKQELIEFLRKEEKKDSLKRQFVIKAIMLILISFVVALLVIFIPVTYFGIVNKEIIMQYTEYTTSGIIADGLTAGEIVSNYVSFENKETWILIGSIVVALLEVTLSIVLTVLLRKKYKTRIDELE